MFNSAEPVRGRGAEQNPPNRFDPIEYVPDPDAPEDERPAPDTRFFRDRTRSIIATNDSPDIPFEASLNPYRGCEHGCVYCFARPTHEYLGFSAGLDFETRIMVKVDAPELLRKELSSPRWRPKKISISGVTDAYQPIERRLSLTRRCLEVLAEFGNPVTVVTKNRLVARDADLLGSLAARGAAGAFLSITTLDPELARLLEPRASAPSARLAAIRELTAAGVPTGVLLAPVIPGLNDHEIPAILDAAAAAGADSAGLAFVRLPWDVAGLLEAWLERHYPDRKAKVMGQIGVAKGGRINEGRFGKRFETEGPLAAQLGALFEAARRRAGLERERPEPSIAAFRRPPGPQLELF